MRMRIAVLLILLLSVVPASAKDGPKVEVVAVSPYASIEAARLSIDDKKKKYSLSLIVRNTGDKNIRVAFFRFNVKGEIRGYAIDMSSSAVGVGVNLPPKEKKSIRLADNADLPPWMRGVSTFKVSVTRVEFDDGTAWEQPEEGKQEPGGTAQPNDGMHPTANSATLIRRLKGLFSCVRGG